MDIWHQKIDFLYLFMGSGGMKKRRRTNYLAKCKAFSPAKTKGFCEFVRTTILHPVAFLIENSILQKVLNEERKGQIRENLPARSGDARNRIKDSKGESGDGRVRQRRTQMSEKGPCCKDFAMRNTLGNALWSTSRGLATLMSLIDFSSKSPADAMAKRWLQS